MTHLELTGDETALLKEILETYLSELRLEIADTERKDFRDVLKEKERFLNEVLGRLAAA